MEIKEASRRRDFTMNAMLLDPVTGVISDPHHGLDDIKSHTLRVVDPKTFGDDPLRIYRAIQFAGRFGMETEPKSTKLLRDMVKKGETDELPKERITEEMRKLLLRSERPSIGLELARIIGLIERDYSELDKLTTCLQKAGSHREGTAWDHTMYVIDAMAKIIRDPKWGLTEHEKLVLMLTAITHDLGKTVAPWRVIQNVMYAYADHPRAGGEPAKKFLSHFSFGDEVNAQVVTLTVNHRRGGVVLGKIEHHNATEEAMVNELRKLIRDISPISWNAYLALSTADTLGVIGWDSRERAHTLVATLDRLVKKHRILTLAKTTLISGKDLLRLGMKPGPKMGALLAEIEIARDDGRVKTRKEALALAKNLTPAKMGK
jgi:tRNA nucleotidyltransferase (CCA-adding enzyme)